MRKIIVHNTRGRRTRDVAWDQIRQKLDEVIGLMSEGHQPGQNAYRDIAIDSVRKARQMVREFK